jgi:1,4-alpha-glucan branching enzyme
MELADQEVQRTQHDLALQPLAVMYRQLFGAAHKLFQRYRGNLLGAFRQLQDEGLIEIVTCPATPRISAFCVQRGSTASAARDRSRDL